MVRYTSIAVVLALALTTPALARQMPGPQKKMAGISAVDKCRAMFRHADTNRDGVLSGRELVAAKLASASDGPLSLAEFVEECLDQD